jgi:hypothetical protein
MESPMTGTEVSIISARFDAALRTQIVEHAKATLATAQTTGQRTRRRRMALLWASAPVALGGLSFVPTDGPRPRPRVAFAQDNVISAESQGLGGGVEDLLPPSVPPVARSPEPLLESERDLSDLDRHQHVATPTAQPQRRESPGKPCASCGKTDATPPSSETAYEPATEDLQPELEPNNGNDRGTPDATPRVLNVGTRFEVTLDLPVQTGSLGTPVAATLAADIHGPDGILLRAGARIVGEAFATTADNRVQLAMTAVVANGKTVRLSGIALGPDGLFGLPGKVVRKGSKTKAGAGRVLGAVGSALSFGVFGSRGGLVDSAAAELARDTGRNLAGVESAWQRSDKVIRVPAGTRLTVYVREDATL